MTPEEKADIDRQIAELDRRLRLLEQIEAAQRDLAGLRDMTPAELEIHVAALDMLPADFDPVRRMLTLLREAEDELTGDQ